MPAARGVKRAASKSSASTASTGPKNKKKRGAIQLEIPSAPKKRGRMLTCGQGDVGQLGLGEDVIETTKFKYVTALGDKIVDVYAGGMHTVALDSNGKVWTFGCNDEGALGRTTTGDGEEGSPRAVSLPARAVRLSAGDSHSAALLLNGDVYAWGAFRDSHGSMGLVVRGREGKPSRTPVKVDIGEQAVDIASGGDHLVILSSSGAVYTMGCGEQGQLGRLSQRSASRDARQGFSALLVPSKVSLKAGASRVWAGYHATFALDAHDKLFAWGLNNYGQLGITGEKRKTALYSPTECDAFNNINTRWQAIACGQHHTVALDEAGLVYTIGRCEYGRLGLGDRSGDAEVPEVVPKLNRSKCISIAAGTSNSFAVTDNGSVFGWGMGSEGQLGSGATDALSPRPATLPVLPASPIAVAAGGQHTVLLIEEPTSQKEASPAPEEEDQPMETEEKETEVPRKRHKQEQDSDVSSTSSAQPVDTPEDTKPPKVNGDEKKETVMEVDDADAVKPTEKSESPDIDKIEAPEKTDEDTEQSEPEKESKPDTDTSSQGTDKSQDTPDTDTQNTPTDKLNGTPEEVIEPKALETIQQPLTTTA